MAKAKNPVGRPTIYNLDMAKRICDLLANTDMTMQEICNSASDFPEKEATIYRWRLEHPEFSEMYAQARQSQADVRADSVYGIAKNCDESSLGSINKAKLMIDSIKWHTSKVLPKVYGDKVQKDININPHEKTIDEI